MTRPKGLRRMNRYHLLFAAVAATFVAGCATAPTPAPVGQDDKTYVTGSRLPARDGDSSSTVNSTSNKQNIDDMMQRGSIIIPPKGGAM
jgi:hypothetical protein